MSTERWAPLKRRWQRRGLRLIIGRSCHKYNFCHDKSFVMTNTCLSWQNTAFVVTKVCLLWQKNCHKSSVTTSLLLCLTWQNTSFATTKVCLSGQNFWYDIFFVSTKVLSRQASFCCYKRRVLSQQTHICRNKHMFVTTKVLSPQQWYLWQLPPMIMIVTVFRERVFQSLTALWKDSRSSSSSR